MRKEEEMIGRQFGWVTVLGRSKKRITRGKKSIPTWKCRCRCGNIIYKTTDVLTNAEVSMCKACAGKYGTEKAREAAGFVGGTQISKIKNMKPGVANTSGVRGVYYEKSSGKWRARLRFQGKIMSFGMYTKFEDAVTARKEAEVQYYGKFLEAQEHPQKMD